MTINFDNHALADDTPVADAVEQLQLTDIGFEDAALDPEHVADVTRDANLADLIDQAIIVPVAGGRPC